MHTPDKPNIIERIEQRLRSCADDRHACWVADLHQALYNLDYLYIGTARAAQALTEFTADTDFGVFAVVGLIQDYEQTYYGEVGTDLSDPEAIANMVGYIGGYALLDLIRAAIAEEAQRLADTQYDPAGVALLAALFDEEPHRDMTEGELAALQRFACQWLDEHPDWWSDWQEEWV